MNIRSIPGIWIMILAAAIPAFAAYGVPHIEIDRTGAWLVTAAFLLPVLAGFYLSPDWKNVLMGACCGYVLGIMLLLVIFWTQDFSVGLDGAATAAGNLRPMIMVLILSGAAAGCLMRVVFKLLSLRPRSS